jgi:imidazolonepropionase-like amidohydrolase
MGISATGGHGDTNGLSPYLHSEELSGVADGVDDIRKKVRFEVKYGAGVIKVMATAGAMSEEESVDAALYTQAELDAVVDEARIWGRRVAAHAHGAEGIKRAVRAGVASIEHGTFLDEEGARPDGRARHVLGEGFLRRRLVPRACTRMGISEDHRQTGQGCPRPRGGL